MSLQLCLVLGLDLGDSALGNSPPSLQHFPSDVMFCSVCVCVPSRCPSPSSLSASVVSLRTVMKSGPEIVKACLRQFFECAADDIEKMVENLKLGKVSSRNQV